MRPMNWERLLAERRVPFVTSGPNVKRGEINIRCPFCGSADPSHHMGINLETGWWSCWRNRSQHSGKSPLRLLMRLLSVPYGEAREIAGLGKDFIDPEGFDAIAARFIQRGKDARPGTVDRRSLSFPNSFTQLHAKRPRTWRCINYLGLRGFDGESAAGKDVDLLCELYALQMSDHWEWKDRVILPYYQDKQLVTWTGRAITEARIRYRDLEVEESLLPPKETLYNHDAIYDRKAHALVIVEGPFDALKLDFYGRPWGVRAVALSTNSVSEEQTFLLHSATSNFEHVMVMMDNASALGLADSMRLKQELNFIPQLRIVSVPAQRKDAGELSADEVITWARALHKE